jgi:mannose/fructose/N-acetylgalactosamine-specific phosphotransferase system component IIC
MINGYRNATVNAASVGRTNIGKYRFIDFCIAVLLSFLLSMLLGQGPPLFIGLIGIPVGYSIKLLDELRLIDFLYENG